MAEVVMLKATAATIVVVTTAKKGVMAMAVEVGVGDRDGTG